MSGFKSTGLLDMSTKSGMASSWDEATFFDDICVRSLPALGGKVPR